MDPFGLTRAIVFHLGPSTVLWPFLRSKVSVLDSQSWHAPSQQREQRRNCQKQIVVYTT